MAKERDSSEQSIGEAWRSWRGKSVEQRAQEAFVAIHERFEVQKINDRLEACRFLDAARYTKTPEEKARLLLEYSSVTRVTNSEYINQPAEVINRDFLVIICEIRQKYSIQ